MCYFDDSTANWDAENAGDMLPDLDFEALLHQFNASSADAHPHVLQAATTPTVDFNAQLEALTKPAVAPKREDRAASPDSEEEDAPSTEESQPKSSRPKRKGANGSSGPSKKSRPDESECEAIDDVEEARRQKRLVKNRLTALRSRQRKKQEFEILRDKVNALETENRRLTAELAARDALLGQLRAGFAPLPVNPAVAPAIPTWGAPCHATPAQTLMATGRFTLNQAAQILSGDVAAANPLLAAKGRGGVAPAPVRHSSGASMTHMDDMTPAAIAQRALETDFSF